MSTLPFLLLLFPVGVRVTNNVTHASTQVRKYATVCVEPVINSNHVRFSIAKLIDSTRQDD